MRSSLYIFILFLYSASGTSIGKGKTKTLKWPSAYSLEATRTSITSGVIESYKIWFTEEKARYDYNGGVVKKIVIADSADFENGIEYEIHPETDEDGEIEEQCYAIEGESYEEKKPQNLLPDTEANSFEFVGLDTVNDKTASKFVARTVDTTSDTTHIVWATFDGKAKSWIPVRYSKKEYIVWTGGLDKYEIWDYTNVSTDKKTLKKKLFNIYKDYSCMYASLEDDIVTKGLKFINPDNDKHVEHVFKQFQKSYGKRYANEPEEAMRRAIFKQNMRVIQETNRKNPGYKLAINHLADRTPEEKKKYRGLIRRPEGKVGTIPFPYTEQKLTEISKDLPTEYDARLYGLVTPVKNQEECGSCWTFGTTAAVEGALARSNGGKLISLANQALIDCAWPFGASGCHGGTDNAAYEWMQEYGLPTEAEYGSYTNSDGECHIKNMTKTYPIKGFTDVTPNSIGALKVALVNHGPLSVSIDAMPTSFTFYSGGIYYESTCDPRSLNHEVTLVGYGQKDDEEFWIIRNSWGPEWGIDGYMHISVRDNACGITTEPTYVVF